MGQQGTEVHAVEKQARARVDPLESLSGQVRQPCVDGTKPSRLFFLQKGFFFLSLAQKKPKTGFYGTIAVFWGFCAFPARILPFAFSTDFWLEFGFWPEFARTWVLAQFCSNLGFGPEGARIWVLAPNVCLYLQWTSL